MYSAYSNKEETDSITHNTGCEPDSLDVAAKTKICLCQNTKLITFRISFSLDFGLKYFPPNKFKGL
jgi:hypothetical protein